MRKPRPLDALLPKTRQAILAAILPRSDQWWYLTDLAKHLHVPPSSLQRELATLVGADILRRRRDGNRVYYQANSQCPFMPELRGLIVKTIGVFDVLLAALTPFVARIQWAFVYGSMARGEEQADSDVDLMIIGDIGLSDLAGVIAEARERLGRAINPTLYLPAEFTKKLQAGYGFLHEVLDKPKLFVLGKERDLAETFARRARRSDAGK